MRESDWLEAMKDAVMWEKRAEEFREENIDLKKKLAEAEKKLDRLVDRLLEN